LTAYNNLYYVNKVTTDKVFGKQCKYYKYNESIKIKCSSFKFILHEAREVN